MTTHVYNHKSATRSGKLTWRDRWFLIWGGPRRFLLRVFLPTTMKRGLEQRRGACKRCGVCCQMSWRCRHLCYGAGLSGCAIYQRQKLPICRDFPIDERDLAYRDRVAPHSACGYYFVDPKKNRREIP